MKTVVHPLLIAALVFPVLSVSKAFAGGPGTPPPFTMHRLAPSQLPYLERESHAISPLDEDRDRINDDRLGWRDRDRDPVDPVDPPVGPLPNGGGASAPLDGGISLLLAAGIGLGLKRAMGKKKASDKDGTADEEGTIIP
jgi:hypothetical protein